MTRTWTLVLALSMFVAACGGSGVEEDVAAPTLPPDPRPTATADPSTELAATPEPPAPTLTDAPGPTITAPADRSLVLTGSGLPAGDYTITVDTGDQQLVSTQSFDGASFSIDLNGTSPEDVGAVHVHAGTNADSPPLLSGTLTDGVGTLNPALPVDLSTASGQYILATPTNGGSSEERSGIWYVLIPRAPGLVLPVLPAEWVYEGWVTIDGVDVTTGRFADPAMADDFDGFSGDQGGPPLPGEDFLLNAPPGTNFPVDLAGLTTFVTIEPAQDASPEPSGLTVLSGQIPADAVDHTIYDMDSTVDALPTLVAEVR